MTAALILAGTLALARPGATEVRLIPIPNGDFEEAESGGNFPDGWESNRKEDISLITDATHGAKAVHVKCPWGWANTNLKDKITKLPDGEEISVGWWVKLENVEKGDSDSDVCRLFIKFRNTSWQETTVELAKFEGKAGWRWMTKKKIKIPDNFMDATLTLSFDGGSRGELSLDRFVFAKGADLPPETITTADEIGTLADKARAAIGRARAAAKRETVEGSAGEALSDARGKVEAVVLLANELEAEARALTAKAEDRSNLKERAADADRAVALVRKKIAEAISLIEEGEAAQKRESTRAKAEEISSVKAAEAVRVLREAIEAADLAGNSLTASLVLAGTWGGGVWRITDENKWQAANADAPQPYTAFLTAAPDGRLFCGGTEATVLDSEDNGKTWSATPTRLPAPATGFVLDPADSARWMITTWGRGVWISLDEGRNWTEAPAPSKFMRGLRVLRMGAGTPAKPYAVADGTTIVRAAAFGGEWSEIARMPRGIKAWDLAVKPTGRPVLLAATDAGVAEIGDDGKPAFLKLEESTGWARAIVTDLDRVLVGTYGGGIVEWRPDTSETPKARRINTDLGNSSISALVASLHPKPAAAEGTEVVSGPRIWTDRSAGLSSTWVNGLACKPGDEKVVYCSTKSGFYRSTDGGANWVLTGTGLVGLNLGHILVDPYTQDNLYMTPAETTNPVGVQKSTDGGKTWVQKNKGFSSLIAMWIALKPDSPSTVIAVTWGGGTYISWDGAENWSRLGGMTQQNCYTVTFGAVSPNTVLAGVVGKIYRLSSMSTWQASDKGMPGLDIWNLAQDPNNGKTWLAGTAGGGLFKSLDDGQSWLRISKGLTTGDIYRVVYHPAKPGVVFIGTKNSSTGRGGSGIFRSLDGGENWAPDNEGLPSLGIEDVLVTPKGLIYVATQNGVYYKQE